MTEKDDLHNGLHINLFLAGRPCLVVGGGKIAFRKIQLLLAAEARITVVSPEVCEDLNVLIESGRVSHIARRFEDADVDGTMLVYAATNSRGANRSVLESSRAKNVLCCCVDGNWKDSDFTTPAITKQSTKIRRSARPRVSKIRCTWLKPILKGSAT